MLFSAMGLLLYVYDRLRQKRRSRTPAISGETIRLKARLRRLVRPTLLLVPAKEPGFSKIGGSPELPAGQTWPVGYEGRSFLAQIDLETLAPHAVIDWLPKEGRFYAFYDSERHGFADVVRILHSVEPAGPPVAAPAGVRPFFAERRVAFMVFTSAPSLDWLGLDVAYLDLDEDEFEQLEAIGDAPPPDELQHRIGGYPNEIQPEAMSLSCEHLARGLPDPIWGEDIPPAIARAAKEWRLLLQIDSDPALKMNFGDGGRLYVFIRERHARAGNFSKTVALWQTY
ncbi:YwqG family protein [Phenylobacterium sp.]|uniref:YwqG family protein n=1 Tax=Phenylobacterium sp. TaxID=1871053 RepID=UPI00286C9522|nr:YwqG family protein [Phenylobacterium sp.]